MDADSPGGQRRPFRVPRDLADPLIRELGGWLDGVVGGPLTDPRREGDPLRAPSLRRLVTAHGLAAALVRDPLAAPATAALPVELQAWLAEGEVRNRRRIERLLEELAAALRALDAAGIGVMPLKGAILATRPGADPFRRPMADLDLLVRPADRDAARAVLTALGYRRRADRSRRPTHDTFERPGNDRVVDAEREHPDNPRRIELHVEVKRHLWGWVDDDDLTDHLWTGAARAMVAGEPAFTPSTEALLAHLAIHATSDLLLTRGRLIQWLDLAAVAGEARPDALAAGPHPRLLYPAIRLAARRLPGRFGSGAGGPDGIRGLEARVPQRLVHWAERVPLDTRAGLQPARLAPGDVATLEARWSRWAPVPWRLTVAHGDIPLPLAGARHLVRVLAVARRRPT